MKSRNETTNFVPPYSKPAYIGHRYCENVMSLTYKHPYLMKNMVYLMGAASLLITPSYLVLPVLGINVSASFGMAASAVGALGSVVSLGTGFLQHKMFGFPVDDSPVYKNVKLNFKMAQAEMTIDDKHMPRLRIDAENHFDAGFAEGYVLAEAMKINLKHTDFLYQFVHPLIGFPNDKQFKAFFVDVLKTIPKEYQEEMHGKVAGYNTWLKITEPAANPLTFERYLLLQLLADHHNYNPFSKNGVASFAPDFACTSFAFRVGDYTFFTRVLDWPSYGVAGKYFLQVDRHIGDVKATMDIGHPLLSGALTVVNKDGLMLEMNVADGEKVKKPGGMPAVFFNRYAAENVSAVTDFKRWLTKNKPLGAYHLTASDGLDTQSFHFYQDFEKRGEHSVDMLDKDKETPSLLMVTNNGIEYKDDKAKTVNYRDSDERKKNIHAFFKQEKIQKVLTDCIIKQKDEKVLPQEMITELQDICLQIARLALVNNCASVLCGVYIYYRDQLQKVSVATDNLYAPSKNLTEFKELNLSGLSKRI